VRFSTLVLIEIVLVNPSVPVREDLSAPPLSEHFGQVWALVFFGNKQLDDAKSERRFPSKATPINRNSANQGHGVYAPRRKARTLPLRQYGTAALTVFSPSTRDDNVANNEPLVHFRGTNAKTNSPS
jgi:hypothetical protein